ncbi:MAG TPA: hypothetical protein PLL72_01520, partial [Burkholderiaceae bacterium]|nr:hypothetical protein [Burkholderiaceae bacterium]
PQGGTVSNSDPVTGQAGWYDLRVRIYPAAPEEPPVSWPQAAAPMQRVPGMVEAPRRRGWMAGLRKGGRS